MPCILTSGRKLACKDTISGIQKVFFADYGTLGNASITAGVVTAFSGTAYSLYQFDIKSASGLEQTITSSNENGTTFYEQKLTLILTKLDAPTQVSLDLIIKSRPHVFVLDNNGNYLCVGMVRGCDTNGSATTGVALGDLNGYTLTITAQEALMAPFVTSSLVTTKIAGGATPTQIAP